MNNIILNTNVLLASARRIRLARALVPIACRWQPAADGRGLTCRWDAGPAAARGAEQPDRTRRTPQHSLTRWRGVIARRRALAGRVGTLACRQQQELRHG